jgi:hypothetical protein
MGAQVGNTRLAGEAAARQRAAASEGIRMRREAAQNAGQRSGGNPGVMGQPEGVSPNTVARQEIYAARPEQVTPFERSGPQFAPGLEANAPRGAFGGRLGPVAREFAEKGSPAYEQMMERVRGMNALRNTGSNF